MRTIYLVLLLSTLTSPVAAKERWCHPRENTARVLSKPAPNAIHKDWSGDSYVGLSWSLKPGRTVRDGQFVFVQGDLYSPRGGLVNKGVFILASEWACD